MILDLVTHEAVTRVDLWETIDDDSIVLTVGSGPLDEYRIWRRDGDLTWTLTLAGAETPGVLTYSELIDAKRDAVRHLTSILWGELTP